MRERGSKPEFVRHHERLFERWGGFFYPWRSEIEEPNGETAYTELVSDHLGPELDVLEAGCGHGTDALALAPQVRSLVGYDAVTPFIETCRQRARAAGIENARFVVANSSTKSGGPLPLPDRAFDLVISRRGPTSFVLDAPRLCRPGAAIVQLCYMVTPVPAWAEALPPALQLAPESESIPGKVHDYLARAGLTLHSERFFDVAERFDDPAELLTRLTWNRDAVDDERAALRQVEAAFARHAVGGALSLRHRRYLWKAVVE